MRRRLTTDVLGRGGRRTWACALAAMSIASNNDSRRSNYERMTSRIRHRNAKRNSPRGACKQSGGDSRNDGADLEGTRLATGLDLDNNYARTNDRDCALGPSSLGELVIVASRGDVLVFLIPCVIDGALLLYFLRGFRAPVSSPAHARDTTANVSSSVQAVRGSVARVGHLVTETADG
jgi:hypothetical protein